MKRTSIINRLCNSIIKRLKSQTISHIYKDNGIPVTQITLSGTKVANYVTISAEARQIARDANRNEESVAGRIQAVCKASHEWLISGGMTSPRYTTYGYMWCYSEDYSKGLGEKMCKAYRTLKQHPVKPEIPVEPVKRPKPNYYIYGKDGSFIITANRLDDVKCLIGTSISVNTISYRINKKYPIGDYFVSRKTYSDNTVRRYYKDGIKRIHKND